MSADTVVSNYANPQNLNRYSYVRNNPLRYTDPTGHTVACNPMEDDCHHDDSSTSGTGTGSGDGQGGNHHDDGEDDDPDPTNGLVIPTTALDQNANQVLLSLCTSRPYDPQCASLLATQEDCNGQVVTMPGGSPIPNGCYLAGFHYEFQLTTRDMWKLGIDALSVVGSLAPVIGLIAWSAPGLAIGEGINVVAQSISIAYNLTNGDLGGFTWDMVQEIGPELVNGGSIFPIVGGAASALDAADIIGNAIVKVPDYKPFRPLPISP